MWTSFLDSSLTNDAAILAGNLEELNQKLIDVYRQCEEYREYNAHLILSKQHIEKQLEEQEQLIKDLQLSNSNSEQLAYLQQHNDSLSLENQQLQFQLNDMEKRLSQISVNSNIQRVDSPREVCGFY
jgi:regulator of replication initiation timing